LGPSETKEDDDLKALREIQNECKRKLKGNAKYKKGEIHIKRTK